MSKQRFPPRAYGKVYRRYMDAKSSCYYTWPQNPFRKEVHFQAEYRIVDASKQRRKKRSSSDRRKLLTENRMERFFGDETLDRRNRVCGIGKGVSCHGSGCDCGVLRRRGCEWMQAAHAITNCTRVARTGERPGCDQRRRPALADVDSATEGDRPAVGGRQHHGARLPPGEVDLGLDGGRSAAVVGACNDRVWF